MHCLKLDKTELFSYFPKKIHNGNDLLLRHLS